MEEIITLRDERSTYVDFNDESMMNDKNRCLRVPS